MQISIPSRYEVLKTSELKKFNRNPVTHSEDQVEKICSSIIEFGFNNPVLVDKKKGIVSGHGRLMAAEKLGIENVPVVFLDHLDEKKRVAYLIADNKLSDLHKWDENALEELVKELETSSDFDLQAMGFSQDELDSMLDDMDLELNEGVGKSKGGGNRRTCKNMIIWINKYNFTITERAVSDKIMKFCDYMKEHEEISEIVNKKFALKIEEVINELFIDSNDGSEQSPLHFQSDKEIDKNKQS